VSRDERIYLEDMARSCRKVLRFVAELDREQFLADEKTYDAVVRNLEIVGEAAKHISVDLQRRLPDVDWRKIAGLRDMLAHAYFGIDHDILWDVVQNKVGQLAVPLERFLEERAG